MLERGFNPNGCMCVFALANWAKKKKTNDNLITNIKLLILTHAENVAFMYTNICLMCMHCTLLFYFLPPLPLDIIYRLLNLS